MPSIQSAVNEFEAVVLDLPDHPSAIEASAPMLSIGGRVACYCPVTAQLERAWEACEAAGLVVEWAGELMQREWGSRLQGRHEAGQRTVRTHRISSRCPATLTTQRLEFSHCTVGTQTGTAVKPCRGTPSLASHFGQSTFMLASSRHSL